MLEAVDVHRRYDGTHAVRGVSLTLAPGRIVGLVGNNGAGKTTTIKMLVGLLTPSSGKVTIDGEATLVPSTRRRIGYLPEESPLYDDLDAVSYLLFFAGLYDVTGPEARRRAEALLSRMGLSKDAWKRPIGTLSKGMRRKIAIARCLLHEPPVIVLDEPTSGLDPETAHELDGFLRELRTQGKAILLSAHNLHQVEQLCDEILIMHGGEIIARGTLQDLRTAFGSVRYVVRATAPFPGSSPDGSLHLGTLERLGLVEEALQQIRAQKGIVVEVTSLFPSLEEIMEKAKSGRA